MGFLCIILIIVCLLAWRQYNKGINHKTPVPCTQSSCQARNGLGRNM